MLLGQMTHEAVQRDKVPFPTVHHRTGERHQVPVRKSFPQCPTARVVADRTAVSFAPRLDVFDGVALFFAEGPARVLRLLTVEELLLLVLDRVLLLVVVVACGRWWGEGKMADMFLLLLLLLHMRMRLMLMFRLLLEIRQSSSSVCLG